MDSPNFNRSRRQQFLTPQLYERTLINEFELIEVHKEGTTSYEEGTEEYVVSFEMLYLEELWLWMLSYTAGMPLADLARGFKNVVDRFEIWNDKFQGHMKNLAVEFPENGAYAYNGAPDFNVLSEYVDTLQMLSIAILLRDTKSVKRIAWILRSHRGTDALFEELLEPFVDDEVLCDYCIHGEPFDTLVESFFTEHDSAIIEKISSYSERWYPAMEQHPRWYDGHLHVGMSGAAPYFGYWAFEAAATAFLLDVDSRGIQSIVFPRDLVTFANLLRDEDRSTNNVNERPSALRVQGGRNAQMLDSGKHQERSTAEHSLTKMC